MKGVNLTVKKGEVVPTWNLSYLSQDEYNEVAKELGERIKNSIYMLADIKAREALIQLQDLDSVTGEDQIHINFDMVFVWQDIVEIVGGFRRKKEIEK